MQDNPTAEKPWEKHEKEAQQLFEKGTHLYNQGDYEASIKLFSEALSLYPPLAGAYYNRGLAKSKICDFQGAIEDYSSALKFNYKLADAYQSRGYAKAVMELEGALEDFNETIKLRPDYSEAYFNRGLVKSKKSDHQGAKKDFVQYLNLTKGNNTPMVKEARKMILQLYPKI